MIVHYSALPGSGGASVAVYNMYGGAIVKRSIVALAFTLTVSNICFAQPVGTYEVTLKAGAVLVRGVPGVKYAAAPAVVMRVNTLTGAVTACDLITGTTASCATSSPLLSTGTDIGRFRPASQTLNDAKYDSTKLIELLIFDSTNGDVYVCTPARAAAPNNFNSVNCLKR